jgi:hypothetical protein
MAYNSKILAGLLYPFAGGAAPKGEKVGLLSQLGYRQGYMHTLSPWESFLFANSIHFARPQVINPCKHINRRIWANAQDHIRL